MSTKLVIFDLDGTLLDTSEGIKASVKYVIEKYNLPLPTETILNSFIGPPIQASFKHLYNLSDEKSTALAALFREQYKSADLFKAKPYDNVFEVLRYLRSNGVKTAVATYKREDYTKLLLDHFGLSKYFDIICGSDFEGKLQKKDIILNAVNKSRFSINDTIMVGDTILDAEAERESSIRKAQGVRESKILEAEGNAEAIKKVAEAKAEEIKMVYGAIMASKPDDKLVAIKSLEALEKVSNGTANKVFIPFDATKAMGALGAMTDIADKKSK